MPFFVVVVINSYETFLAGLLNVAYRRLLGRVMSMIKSNVVIMCVP